MPKCETQDPQPIQTAGCRALLSYLSEAGLSKICKMSCARACPRAGRRVRFLTAVLCSSLILCLVIAFILRTQNLSSLDEELLLSADAIIFRDNRKSLLSREGFLRGI